MVGIYYDFIDGDIHFDSNGAIEKAVIDNQNCALIACSEVCRLTKPELGAVLGARILNRHPVDATARLAEARRMVEDDGGKKVTITLTDSKNVEFHADYGAPYILPV